MANDIVKALFLAGVAGSAGQTVADEIRRQAEINREREDRAARRQFFEERQERIDAEAGRTGAIRAEGEVAERLELLISELQGVSHRVGLLLDMVELLRIPESQRQRQHHIEMGLRFLENASTDGDFYEDALRELLDAEKLMLSDYFVLYHIGLIYRHVPALGNLEKALDYLSRAAKYALVESNPEAVQPNTAKNKITSKLFIGQKARASVDLSEFAAECCREAGTTLYSLSRFEEAAKMAEKAVKCRPADAKHHFLLAKCLTRLNETETAVSHLQKAIDLVPEMALSAVSDVDLNRSQPILDLLRTANDRASAQLTSGVDKLVNWLGGDPLVRETPVPELITSAQESLKGGDYPQKRALLARLANYDNAMLLPGFSIAIRSLHQNVRGHEQIKVRLAKAFISAKGRGVPLDHLLLLNPIGIEKVTVAATLAKEVALLMGTNVKCVEASAIKKVGDLAGLLTNLQEGDVLFIERVDQLEPLLTEYLVMAMRDFKLDVVTDQGPNARSVKLYLPSFTFIGTTPAVELLSNELVSAFQMVECLEAPSTGPRSKG